jgi:hypothetical protein
MCDCAIVVPSCDAYSDLWEPFLRLLDKYWLDRSMPIYFGTNELSVQGRVVVLMSDRGSIWSDRLIDYLQRLDCEYVLLMLEDFFLRRPVRDAEVQACLTFMRESGAHMVRLVPLPRPTCRLPGNHRFGICEPGSPYRLSTQAAIWRRSTLLGLLRPGETIWQFEIAGSQRSSSLREGFYSVWKPVLPYPGMLVHHVVEKGKWFPHEAWRFRRAGIGCDFARRGTLPWGHTLMVQCVRVADLGLRPLPWRARERVKVVVRRLLEPVIGTRLSRLRGVSDQDLKSSGSLRVR